MTNRQRGDVALMAGARRLILRFTTNSLCMLEDAVECGVATFAERLSADLVDFRTSRLLVWAACQAENPGMTRDEAGDVIDAAGLQAAVEAAAKALERAFPEADSGNGPAAAK